ncbi:MAG: 50S ribosomal protein L20 [Candidatus Marinimicrobia bacterium]|nr:50S ribosomal protein L20 [Candidatus Neomarinimicrobiota bacterium]
MPRANSSVPHHRRHRKMIKMAKGYYSSRGNLYVNAKDTVEKALLYQYRDRRNKKRMFRRLWITRINAAARLHGMSYSVFMHKLQENDISLDRKILAHLAATSPDDFKAIVDAIN